MSEENQTKIITEVYCPEDGDSHGKCWVVGFNGVKSITMQNEFHGEYDINWIVIEQDDKTRKINERQVTEIVWSYE